MSLTKDGYGIHFAKENIAEDLKMKMKDLKQGDFFTSNKINSGKLCQLLVKRGEKILTFPTTRQHSAIGFIKYESSFDNFDCKIIEIKGLFEYLGSIRGV
jgi:hypothetical protein